MKKYSHCVDFLKNSFNEERKEIYTAIFAFPLSIDVVYWEIKYVQ